MITVEQLAVDFVTTGEVELRKGMESIVVGADSAAESLSRLPQAAEEASKAEEMLGQMSEMLSHRLEHLSVMAAFALTSIATGGEDGLTRFTHAIALFGFAFDPMVGAITTFTAVAGEQLIRFFKRSQDEAKKAAESNRKFLDSIDEAKNLSAAALKAQQLYSGAPFTTETDPKLREAILSGGVQNIIPQIDELTKKLAEAKKKRDALLASDPDYIHRQTSDAAALAITLQTRLDALTSKFGPAIKAYRDVFGEVSKLMGGEGDKAAAELRTDLWKRDNEAYKKAQADAAATVKKNAENALHYLNDLFATQAKDQLDAKEKNDKALKEQDVASFDRRIALARENVGDLLTLEDQRVQAVKKLYGADSKEYQDALTERDKALAESAKKTEQQADEYEKEAKARIDAMNQKLSQSASGALESLFDRSPNMGSFFDRILSALGSFLIQLGSTYLAMSGIFEAIAAALTNPFTAGPALAAYGVALIALGAAIHGATSHAGGGSGARSSSVGSQPSASTPTMVLPASSSVGVFSSSNLSAVPSFAGHVTIIGKNDPEAQRELREMFVLANRR